jgi:hypothetical protein
MNMVGGAVGLVYGGVIMAYGGPLGMATTYLSVSIPFLGDLPISSTSAQLADFWKLNAPWSTRFDMPTEWVIAHTRIDPKAQGTPFDYSWDSEVPAAFHGNWDITMGGYKNLTVTKAAAISANTLSVFNLLPFQFAGKSWGANGLSNPVTLCLKWYGMALSFLLIEKLKYTKAVVTGADGAILIDGGMTDNMPLTQVLATSSRMPASLRAAEFLVSGPANTMRNAQYLAGMKPMGLWTFGGMNMCPFTQVSICTMMGTVRSLLLGVVSSEVYSEYKSIGSAFEIWRPEMQVYTPFCGDPLNFDHFSGQCYTDGMCHMFITILPNQLAGILPTPENWNTLLSQVFLSATPVSKRFVLSYIPPEMTRLKYYENMGDWFPDFAAVAPENGGVVFNNPAGHSLQDYVTYLIQRLTKILVYSKLTATAVWYGVMPSCGYEVYQAIEKFAHADTGGLKWVSQER